MITTEKLKIYDAYNGDIDCLLRNGRKFENDLFDGNDDWGVINNFYHDILLINDWLASKVYAENSMIAMRKHCDDESYQMLMNNLY